MTETANDARQRTLDRAKEREKRLQTGHMRREADTIRALIGIYCHDHHGGDTLCESCAQLQAYALKRLSCCPFGTEKPVCAKCKVHCYRGDMRARIADVMRYSGPRLMFKHPLLTAEHMWRSWTVKPPEKPRNVRKPRPQPRSDSPQNQ